MSALSRTAPCTLALSLLACTVAQAQEDALEEVTVTAQKREQNLQDVGISVAAVSGEQLRSQGLTDPVAALMKVPNVDEYSPYGRGTSANIVIRGIGLNDFGEGHEAPVTAYVDEIYMVAVPAVDGSMFDMSQMAVLRGPQGTLFGRNSTGGSVQFTTAKPTDTPQGFLQVNGGNFGERKVEGAISGPVVGSLDGRLSVLSDHSDGYIRNVTPGLDPAGNNGTDAVRGQLQWTGSDGLKILGKAEYASTNIRQTYYKSTPIVQVASNGGLWSLAPKGTDFAGYNQLTFDNGIASEPGVADTNDPNTLRSHTTTLLLRIEKELGRTTLTAVSGYVSIDRNLQEDCDGSPNTVCFAHFPYSSHWFTQEIRWGVNQGPTRWTTGLYFLDSDAKNHPSAVFNIPVSGPTALSPTTGLYDGAVLPIALGANWKLNTKSYSAFGQIEQDLGSSFTVLAGTRVTHDRKDFRDADNASLRTCQNFAIPTNCLADYTANPYEGIYDKTLYSGKVELDWHALDHTLVYASFSHGTKAGGFNNGFYPAGIKPAQIPYEGESVNVYEAGEKTTFADGRVRLNTAAFHYSYENYQAFDWQGVGGLITNRPAHTAGGEMELEVLLHKGWTATLSAGALHTEIKDLILRDGITARDTQMANAPHFSTGSSLTWDTRVGANGTLSATWDFNYVTSRYANNFNDPATLLEAYFKHNARLTWSPTDHWSLGAYVNNISDIRNTARVFVFDSLGYLQTIQSEPRTFGGDIGYHF